MDGEDVEEAREDPSLPKWRTNADSRELCSDTRDARQGGKGDEVEELVRRRFENVEARVDLVEVNGNPSLGAALESIGR